MTEWIKLTDYKSEPLHKDVVTVRLKDGRELECDYLWCRWFVDEGDKEVELDRDTIDSWRLVRSCDE